MTVNDETQVHWYTRKFEKAGAACGSDSGGTRTSPKLDDVGCGACRRIYSVVESQLQMADELNGVTAAMEGETEGVTLTGLVPRLMWLLSTRKHWEAQAKEAMTQVRDLHAEVRALGSSLPLEFFQNERRNADCAFVEPITILRFMGEHFDRCAQTETRLTDERDTAEREGRRLKSQLDMERASLRIAEDHMRQAQIIAAREETRLTTYRGVMRELARMSKRGANVETMLHAVANMPKPDLDESTGN